MYQKEHDDSQNILREELKFAKFIIRLQQQMAGGLKNGFYTHLELKGLKKLNKLSIADLTTRMKHLITSVNGDRDIKSIREFVDGNFLARDARALRQYVADVMPDIDLTFDFLEN